MAEMEPGSWERQTLEKVALAAINEQRRGRNWGIFFKLLLFIYLFALLFIGMGWFGKKDAASGKPTYPSMYGVERSRRMAQECLERAGRRLAAAGVADQHLLGIGRWIVERSN